MTIEFDESEVLLRATLRAELEALGPAFDHIVLGRTRELYSPLVQNQPIEDSLCTADLCYGEDQRQKLDLYHGSDAGRPTVLFVPGGGFVAGEKDGPFGFYRNVGINLARHGFACAVMNYRLAPEHAWPAGSEDVARAAAWLREHVNLYGGDPERIILWGHSAGGTHVAGYLFHPRWRDEQPLYVGAMLMSAAYDFRDAIAETPDEIGANIRAYVGTDAAQYSEMSPISHVSGTLPIIVGLAALDPPFLASSAFDMAKAITARDGRSPDFVWIAGHNHVSAVQAIGSSVDDSGPIIVSHFNALLAR